MTACRGLLTAACLLWLACAHTAPRRWLTPNNLPIARMNRIGVLAAPPLGANGQVAMVPMLKAMASSLSETGGFRVPTYRDVLIARQSAQVNLRYAGNGPDMDRAQVDSLASLLKVDALCIVWIVSSGASGGERVTVRLYSGSDGRELGSFATARGGLSSDGTGWYDMEDNCSSMAEEAVKALLKQM